MTGTDQNRRFEGGCLCGAVRFRGSGPPMFVSHCQCVTCRKSSGTGHSTDAGFKTEQLAIAGKLRAYGAKADSGNTVEISFCPICGTKISAANDAYPDVLAMNLAAFDDPGAFTPTTVFFTRSAVPWDLIDDALKSHETQP